MHQVRFEGTDDWVWAPDYVVSAWWGEPSPWCGRLAERNERIWQRSRYRTPWQIAVAEGLSEARVRQIIDEGADFYDRL